MTPLPQTQNRAAAAFDVSRRTASSAPGTAQSAGTARDRLRQTLPAVDPSKEFGCVDWFLYPDAPVGEAQARRVPA
ncbi:MAG TPA: hypothetical protein VFN79_15275 [Steroidobacteraceae bacterium]|nr:hypothetical protein [Steroidobacteraceae bacterium]